MSVINDRKNSNFYKICERMKHLMAVVATRSRCSNVTALGFTFHQTEHFFWGFILVPGSQPYAAIISQKY